MPSIAPRAVLLATVLPCGAALAATGPAAGPASSPTKAPSAAGAETRTPEAASPDFAGAVRPILADRCMRCHGPDEAARKGGLRLDLREGALDAIVPGDADASVIFERLLAPDDDRMPPEAAGPRLTEAELEVLRRWIDAGATYEPHWAFEPPRAHEPPQVLHEESVRNDIDRFVLARLESAGLSPSPEADLRTLARRVALDLTGLPPDPDRVDALVGDADPGAYERFVDELLADPAFGERWARPWLDLARYADTKGYEKDARRTMWPYRDWVVDAMNRDLPFDAFTIEQLAGDLLPGATTEQRIATAFHRNTMTNDEGGTDDEEFRSAAVVDRVNTTMQAWMGITMACAQCHTHKYDPITDREYFRFYAYLDNTADADRPDDAPLIAAPTREQQGEVERLEAEARLLDRRVQETADAIAYQDPLETEPVASETPGADPPEADPGAAPHEWTWFDDELPRGAQPTPGTWPVAAAAGADGVSVPPHAGAAAFVNGPADGMTQLYFVGAHDDLEVRSGDRLFVHVRLDPENAPQAVMLQFHTRSGSWEHRAYWGADAIALGQPDTGSRHHAGPLPAPGAWTRLEVDAAAVGLAPGTILDGIAFSQHAGRAWWDAAGVVSSSPRDERHRTSLIAWEQRVQRRDDAGVPAPVRAALEVPVGERTDAQRATVRRHYLAHVHDPSRDAFAPLLAEQQRVERALADARAAMPRLPILQELEGDARRVTRIHERGSFLSPGDVVEPGVPAVFHDPEAPMPADRLAMARWLVDRRNPLTARVLVNRIWEQIFGAGIVTTVEDFGTQGALPTHPQLLDTLAVELMDGGWSRKALLRRIVLSGTYRQSSAHRADLAEIDPYNRLLGRAPRRRLSAEAVRDQALAVSGLLSRRVGGPPVFPPQPEGVWQVVYSGDSWKTSAGADRYRRGLYTFWRRTSPYPSMAAFDAPSREFCVSRRVRTNTPLQAFVTLNDPGFVEAARALARRVHAAAEDDAARIAQAFRLCLQRMPTEAEVEALRTLVDSERRHFGARGEDARALAAVDDGGEAAELAAWVVVSNVMLNLDEFLTKG